jgi:hypothetical protein
MYVCVCGLGSLEIHVCISSPIVGGKSLSPCAWGMCAHVRESRVFFVMRLSQPKVGSSPIVCIYVWPRIQLLHVERIFVFVFVCVCVCVCVWPRRQVSRCIECVVCVYGVALHAEFPIQCLI